MVISDKNRDCGRARDLLGRATKRPRPPAPLFRLIETDRASVRRRPSPGSEIGDSVQTRRVAGDAGERPTAREERSRVLVNRLSRVRFPANRTLSRRRRMTESEPKATIGVIELGIGGAYKVFVFLPPSSHQRRLP